jgi:hypothetical protein
MTAGMQHTGLAVSVAQLHDPLGPREHVFAQMWGTDQRLRIEAPVIVVAKCADNVKIGDRLVIIDQPCADPVADALDLKLL